MSVTLGIAGLEMQIGDHVCAFYRGVERDELLIPFLEAGMRTGDKCICVVDSDRPETLIASLERELAADCVERHQLAVLSSESAYLVGGEFVPTRMVQFWDDNVRSVGEMTWALRDARGVDQLVSYESELNRFLPRYPQVILCLYDVERFGGDIILDMLKTHPKVLLNGMVLDNPYYLEPDEFLARLG